MSKNEPGFPGEGAAYNAVPKLKSTGFFTPPDRLSNRLRRTRKRRRAAALVLDRLLGRPPLGDRRTHVVAVPALRKGPAAAAASPASSASGG
jgi:hypothetical protein